MWSKVPAIIKKQTESFHSIQQKPFLRASNKKTKLLIYVYGGYRMITKTKFWQTIREELKNKHRANKATEEVMRLIRNVSQNENKENKT